MDCARSIDLANRQWTWGLSAKRERPQELAHAVYRERPLIARTSMLKAEPLRASGVHGSSILHRQAEVGHAPVVRDESEGESRPRSPRRRVLRRALIVYRGGNCTLGCNILNVSESGALLMPADILLCPSTFVLKPQDGPSHQCEVVWRKGELIGVRFL